jgi:SET domain-containing protein
MKYKPLPNTLTIKESDIEGLGLFATKDIKKNTNLGMMHYITEFSEVIRTPLGGFINHSNKPNCIKEKEDLIYEERTYLITNRLIKKGEELTVKYTMYKV